MRQIDELKFVLKSVNSNRGESDEKSLILINIKKSMFEMITDKHINYIN